MNTVNYFGTPSAQALGAAMMPLGVQDAMAAQSGNPMGGVSQMSPQTMQSLMSPQGGGVMGLTPTGIPADAMSWNTGAGPLPWLSQNALPWLSGATDAAATAAGAAGAAVA